MAIWPGLALAGAFMLTTQPVFAGECPAAEYATIEVREVGPCWEK